MKISIFGRILFLSILLSSALSLSAQCTFSNQLDCPNTIISAVPFLRIIPDARAAGMGDAGIAVSPDANTMHHNASKLAFIDQNVGLSATYSPWLRSLGLQDVYLAYLSGFKKIDDLTTIGASLRYFSLGEIAFTDVNGEPLGIGKPNEFEVAVAYARKLSDKFSAGVTGKFIYSNLAAGQQVDNIDIVPGVAGAVDISFTYLTPMNIGARSDLRVGMAISNLGSKISYTKSSLKDFLPANLGLGAALDIDFDDFNRLTFTAEINKLLVPTPNDSLDADGNGISDYREKGLFEGVFGSFGDAPNGFKEELREISYSVGVEYWYAEQFALRAGYYYEHPTKGNRQFLTLGIGIKYNIFGMNLSYLVPTSNVRSPLDNTLRFSLLFDFAAAETTPE
jgi:hypothetical protein